MTLGADGPEPVTADDLLSNLTLDDPATESATPPAPEASADPALEVPPADPSPESPEPSSPETPGASEVPADPIPTFTPPTGEPFTLRVDRQAFPMEGAVVTPDKGVYFSPEAWRKVQTNFVGDRRSWQAERQHLLAQVKQSTEAKSAREHELDAKLAAVNELFTNPDKLAQEFEQWQVKGPILLAEARLKAEQTRAEAAERQIRDREEAEETARLIPQMQHWLGKEVETLLADPDYTGLFEQDDAVALVRELWEQHRAAFFFERPDGKIDLDREALRTLLEPRASWMRRVKGSVKQVEQKKATNAAALAPTKPGPTTPRTPPPLPPKPRDDAGRFKQVSRKQQKQQARALLDDLTLDDASA